MSEVVTRGALVSQVVTNFNYGSRHLGAEGYVSLFNFLAGTYGSISFNETSEEDESLTSKLSSANSVELNISTHCAAEKLMN